MRGNAIDMAVGVIIGAAFGKIVDSLVKDIVLPPIGVLVGNMDFSNLFWVLKDVPGHEGEYASLAQATAAGATTLNIGNFLNVSISFLIIAFVVFILVKAINKVECKILKKEADEAAAKAKKVKVCPFCREEIDIEAVRCPHCTSHLDDK